MFHYFFYMDAIHALWRECCDQQRHKGYDRTHLIGRAAESFVQHLTCPACGGFQWKSYADNHPAFDLTCEVCSTNFQIKARNDLKPSSSSKVLRAIGATYTKVAGAVGSVAYLLVSYVSPQQIRCLYYVPIDLMSMSYIHAWNPTVSNTLCTISFPKGTYQKIRLPGS